MGNNPINGVDPDGGVTGFLSDMVLSGVTIKALSEGTKTAIISSYLGLLKGLLGGCPPNCPDFRYGPTGNIPMRDIAPVPPFAESIGYQTNSTSKPTAIPLEKVNLSQNSGIGALSPTIPWWSLFGGSISAEALLGVTAAVAPIVAGLTLTGDAPQSKRIALGVDEYLFDFAEKTQSIPYNLWGNLAPDETSLQAYRVSIIAMGQNPGVTFHFNLSTPRGLVTDPINLQSYGNSFTTMEYQIVSKLFPHKTTFYIKSGSIYRPINR